MVIEYVLEDFCHNSVKRCFLERVCTLSQRRLGFENRLSNNTDAVASLVSLGYLDYFPKEIAKEKT